MKQLRTGMWVVMGMVAGGMCPLGPVAGSEAYVRPPAHLHLEELRRFQGIPSIAVAPRTGRLWATWYCGVTPREDANNYVVLASSGDGGETWTEVLVADPDGMGGARAFDPEVWVAPDGRLRWTWTEGSAGHRLMGVSLNAEQLCVPPYPQPAQLAAGVMMCKPTVLRSGDWLYPVSQWRQAPSALALATRDGVAFTRRGGVTLPENLRTFDEHQFVERADGSLLVFLRTLDTLRTATSRDGGATWSAPEKPANLSNTATRLCVRRLKSGSLLLVKNGTQAGAASPRVDLTAYVSQDDGATWKGGLLIDARAECTYPDFDEGADGVVHLVYDHDRTAEMDVLYARFTEADALAGKDVSGKVALKRVLACHPSRRTAARVQGDPAALVGVRPRVNATPEVLHVHQGKAGLALPVQATTAGGRVWNLKLVTEADSTYLVATWSGASGSRDPALVVRGGTEEVPCAIGDPSLTIENGTLVLTFVQGLPGGVGQRWSMHTHASDAGFPEWSVPIPVANGGTALTAAAFKDSLKTTAAVEAACAAALEPPAVYVLPDVPERYRPENEKFVMNNGCAVTEQGRIWVTWIGGEDSDEAYTLGAFSDDGGKTWENPALVVDGHIPGYPIPRSNIIANFWIDPNKTLHLFFSQSCWHNDGRMGVWEIQCANPDAARPVWTAPRRLSDGAALNKPIVAQDGTWLLPVEIARPYGIWQKSFGADWQGQTAGATLLASTDQGCTWTRRGTARVPNAFWPENHLVEMRNGDLRMYMRSLEGLKECTSTDGGRTWGTVTAARGINQVVARCQIRRLRSGNWIFIRHEGAIDSFQPYNNDQDRNGIYVYLSKDEGASWSGPLVVDSSRMVSYPDVEQTADGRIWVTHDFERQTGAEIRLHVFREADILAGKIVSSDAQLGIRVTKAMSSAYNKVHR